MIHVDISYRSINKYGEELCGDKVEIVRTDDSDILVLSDGLGSGVKANILSTLTSKIIITMLKEGSSVDEAVETIAKTLPICKVRQLAYSTFSILQIFHDGKAYLVEFDNPSCVFVRNNEIVDIPYDIREIAGKSVRESRFDVAIGDSFVLTSDGVIHAGVGGVLNLGWQWDNLASCVLDCAQKNMSASRTAASVIQVVDNLFLSKPGDDSTVLAAKIVKQKVVNVFSGPPENPDNDEIIIKDWMRSPGKKVVCGGTSANIVGRVLNRPIKTSLDFTDSSVPPIAFISGIDLVTEGVLTINKAIEIIKEFVDYNKSNTVSDFKEIDGKNGAAMLARMLVEEATDINFFVGKAINPAHQNPNLPMDLSIKLRLITELKQLLKELGKNVEIKYY